MRKISVQDIESDMVLARDVSSTSGNVLLGKGTALTPALGRRLKNWGIFFVYVEGEEEAQLEEKVVEISPEEEKKHLELKFSDVLHDPIMGKLFTAVLEYKINRKNG
jgi:hypothetical protein